jgi:hypothetical protein
MSLDKKTESALGPDIYPLVLGPVVCFLGAVPYHHTCVLVVIEREKGGCAGDAGQQVSRSVTLQQIWLDLPTTTNGEKHSCSQLTKSNNTRSIVGMSMIGFEGTFSGLERTLA